MSAMPFNVDVWVDDRDDGTFVIYIGRDLITDRGAEALQQMLSTTIAGWRRLDDSLVYATLRAVTG
ncbi:hypothetical protein ACH4MG_27570 [Streptomyces sp. NPDC017454]|uniref:hypothetical protein n=1 Tax=unclassified Streptomyces TaxID=2593676 RepID=UPI00333056DF